MRMMQDNTVLPFENRYAFRSPTGLIKDFHEELILYQRLRSM
jgi:hypothetical protein